MFRPQIIPSAGRSSGLNPRPTVASDGVGVRLVMRPHGNGVGDAVSDTEHETVAAAEAHEVHAGHVSQLFLASTGRQFAFEQFLYCRPSCSRILGGSRLAFLLKLPVGSRNRRRGGWLLFIERREPLRGEGEGATAWGVGPVPDAIEN